MKLEASSGNADPRQPFRPPVHIWLVGPIRGKQRPRFRRAGAHVHTYTPSQTVKYEAALRQVAQIAMAGRLMFLGAVKIDIVANFDVPKSFSNKLRAEALAGIAKPTKKPDWENIAKLTDALNGVVWKDDAQVVYGTILKRYAALAGLQITVTEE